MDELERLTDTGLVKARTLERAEQAGASAEREAEVKFDQYSLDNPDSDYRILTTEQIQRIILLERTAAVSRFITEREAGLHNDTVSLGPGFVVLLGVKAKAHIEAGLIDDNSSEFVKPTIDEVGKNQAGLLYRVIFPDGVFGVNGGDFAIFYERAEMYERENRLPKIIRVCGVERICIKTDEGVIRIENMAGALWQNPAYRPDGSEHEALT